jgi:hypothetical protein
MHQCNMKNFYKLTKCPHYMSAPITNMTDIYSEKLLQIDNIGLTFQLYVLKFLFNRNLIYNYCQEHIARIVLCHMKLQTTTLLIIDVIPVFHNFLFYYKMPKPHLT